MNGLQQRWFRLFLGFAVIALFVGLLHLGSICLGGAPGRMIDQNRQRDLEVYAYVYSEVGDLKEFLDDDEGKYGRAALIEALRLREPCRPRPDPGS